jgi:hypothetical protein
MRAVLATVVAALAVAAPAAAVTIPKSVTSALSGQVSAARDNTKSCQAGTEKAIIFKNRHPQVVACEQPPRSNLLTPDQVAKATAAAIAALG